MYQYKGTATNDETFTETFEIIGADITNWTIEFVVNKIPATITKLSTTQFSATQPLTTMQGFCPGVYPVGCRYTDTNGITDQLLVGSLDVIEGNFS